MATKTAAKKKPAAKKAMPFGKPKAAKGDGTFEFQLPENLGSGRGRIPKGKYIGRCTSIVSETSKSSGNPMWTWEFVITKGPHAGRDFKLWTVLTDDAAWKVAETLTALGVKVTPGEKLKLNKKDVIGVGVTMHIKDDAGQDGDGEFSKLDKISAHPEGAGHKIGGGLAAKGKKAAAPVEDEDDEDLEDEDDIDEEDDDVDEDDDDLDDDDLDDLDDEDDEDEDDEDLDDEDDDDLDDDDLDDLDDEDEDDVDEEDDEVEEDDEEDEPAPKSKSKAKAKPAAKKPAAKKAAPAKKKPARR